MANSFGALDTDGATGLKEYRVVQFENHTIIGMLDAKVPRNFLMKVVLGSLQVLGMCWRGRLALLGKRPCQCGCLEHS
jgi:hypothetical protein